MYSLISQGSNGSPAPVRLLRLSWLLKQARRRAGVPFRRLPPSPLPFLLFQTASMAHALKVPSIECEWERSEMCELFTWPENS
jgi:hypothetical protein